MDLISREAAIEYLMTNMGWTDEDGYAVDDADEKRAHIEDLINGVPSVPTVPLDKLCELLSKGAYPCTILSASLCPFEECIATSRYSNNVSKDCWRAVLEKWMEEQDADRQ